VYPTDGFVAELNTNGSALVYSTYLGGTAMDVADAIAVDPAGNAYVTGYTFSSNFPVTAATAFQTGLHGGSDLFFTKLAANGTAVSYSTYLGGTNTDEGQGIAVDAAGFAYLTGYTASTNFPVTANALQPQINRSTNAAVTFRGRAIPLDAFLLKFDATASGLASLVYSTLFGGTNSDAGYRITLDSSANAYVTGNSSSPDFTNTATNVIDLHVGANGTNVLNTDAFLTKFSFGSNGAAIVYSALFGGKTNDVGWDVGVDAAGNAFVAGVTWSHDFPTNNPPQFLSITNRGNADAFVTAFNTNASALLYSAYLGGSGDDFGYGIAVDPSGNAYVVGRTLSANFALTNATLFQASRDGTNDAFIAKILLQPLLVASPAGGNIELKWRAFAPEFFLETNPGQTGASNWTFASPAPPAANGWHTITLPATNGSSRFRLKR
jgi:hypothetical protein